MKLLKSGQIVELKIDRLATGGFGVGRFEGMVVFVPYSAPGDHLKATVTEVKKNFAYADVVEILQPSPHRVTPKCTHYGVCGGCNWQHISYEEQLRQKQEILNWIFRSYNCVHPIVPSPQPWKYRRRVQLHQKNNQIGYLKRGSHQIVEIDECPIARHELQQAWPKSLDPKLGEKFELGLSEEGQIYQMPLSQSLPEFTQVNIEQNEALRKAVVSLVQEMSPKRAFDLYCGAGNFAFALASAMTDISITGIDIDSRVVQKANEKARQQKLVNLSFEVQSDSAINRNLDLKGSVVILDPPRAGCSRALIEKLLSERPTGIVYVSCHPQTAERDIKLLSKSFVLQTLLPFDMFPQTDHIEVVGLLR